MKFEVVRADKAASDTRMQMAEIFAEGFSQWLQYFSKDKKVIAKAFASMFVLDQFYVAVKDGKVAGMAACTDCYTNSVVLNKKDLRKHLGFVKGSLAWFFLRKEFMGGVKNPQANTGSIEYVGTSFCFQRQGVASLIIEHIIKNTDFTKYIIVEVADTNTVAMNLYMKLGFVEYDRVIMPPNKAKKIGINSFISLERLKQASSDGI